MIKRRGLASSSLHVQKKRVVPLISPRSREDAGASHLSRPREEDGASLLPMIRRRRWPLSPLVDQETTVALHPSLS
jgi:hypothetical protein